jgi:hypothetical protein
MNGKINYYDIQIIMRKDNKWIGDTPANTQLNIPAGKFISIRTQRQDIFAPNGAKLNKGGYDYRVINKRGNDVGLFELLEDYIEQNKENTEVIIERDISGKKRKIMQVDGICESGAWVNAITPEYYKLANSNNESLKNANGDPILSNTVRVFISHLDMENTPIDIAVQTAVNKEWRRIIKANLVIESDIEE